MSREEVKTRKIRLQFDDNTFAFVIKVRCDEFNPTLLKPVCDKNSEQSEDFSTYGPCPSVRAYRHTLRKADKGGVFADLQGNMCTWVAPYEYTKADGTTVEVPAHFRMLPVVQPEGVQMGAREISPEHEQAVEDIIEMLKEGPVRFITPCVAAGCGGGKRVLDFSTPGHTFVPKYKMDMFVDGTLRKFEIDLAVLYNGTVVFLWEVEHTHSNETPKTRGFALHYPDKNAQVFAKSVTATRASWEADKEKNMPLFVHSVDGQRFGAAQACAACRQSQQNKFNASVREAQDKRVASANAVDNAVEKVFAAMRRGAAVDELERLYQDCVNVLAIAVHFLGNEWREHQIHVFRVGKRVDAVRKLEAVLQEADEAHGNAAHKVGLASTTRSEASFAAADSARRQFQACLREIGNLIPRCGGANMQKYREAAEEKEEELAQGCRKLVQDLQRARDEAANAESRKRLYWVVLRACGRLKGLARRAKARVAAAQAQAAAAQAQAAAAAAAAAELQAVAELEAVATTRKRREREEASAAERAAADDDRDVGQQEQALLHDLFCYHLNCGTRPSVTYNKEDGSTCVVFDENLCVVRTSMGVYYSEVI
jgi:hypothetical protein